MSDMALIYWCEKRGSMRVLRNKVFMNCSEEMVLLHGDSLSNIPTGFAARRFHVSYLSSMILRWKGPRHG